MKRIIFVYAITFCLLSCGGDKHEPVELKDTAAINITDTIEADSSSMDSTNGAMIRPIDTANSARRHPQQ